MSDRLIDRVRAKYPQYADVPDDKLTLAIGTKFPAYLERDAKFAANFEAFGQMQANNQDTAARSGFSGQLEGVINAAHEVGFDAARAVDREVIQPLTGGTAAEWAAAVPEAASLMLRQPLREAGKVFSTAGNLLAEDVRKVTGLTSLDPAGPVAQGLQDVGRSAPVLGASMALSAYGVPPMAAFGGPMAAQTYGETGDPQAAFQAGVMGAAIPAVAQAGKSLAVGVNRQLIQRGLMSPQATATQKAVEVLGSQGAVQVFMEGLRLPEYAALPPQERKEAILRNLVANTAFLALDVPGFRRSLPSETQARLSPAEHVAVALRDAANHPEVIEALRQSADEIALAATRPEAGSGEQGDGPLFRREAPLGEVGPGFEAPKMVRLYRGETKPGPPSWGRSGEIDRATFEPPEFRGRWFTPDPDVAKPYARAAHDPDGRIIYVDVPEADLEAYRVVNVPGARKHSLQPRSEFVLPPELVRRARTLPKEQPPGRAAAVPRGEFRIPNAEPGRPLDPFATDQGVGENVPAEGIDVVGMGRRVKQQTPETLPGTRSVAQRMVNAEDRFLEFAMQTAGLTQEQATTALAEYRKAKAIKFDPVGGQFAFTHGGFAEAEVLRRAAGVASAEAPAVPAAESMTKPAEVRPAEPTEPAQAPAAAAPAMQGGMDNLRFVSEVVKRGRAGKGKPLVTDAKDAKAKLIGELGKAVEAAPTMQDTDNPRQKVTIEIPGDGTLTVWNTKEQLGQLLGRAKRLETGASVSGKAPVARAAKMDVVRVIEDARKVYGDRRAADVLQRQAEDMELEIEPKQRELLAEAAVRLRNSLPPEPPPVAAPAEPPPALNAPPKEGVVAQTEPARPSKPVLGGKVDFLIPARISGNPAVKRSGQMVTLPADPAHQYVVAADGKTWAVYEYTTGQRPGDTYAKTRAGAIAKAEANIEKAGGSAKMAELIGGRERINEDTVGEAKGGAAGSPLEAQGQFGLPALPAGTATAVPSKRMVVTMERLVPGFTTVAKIEARLSAIVDVARGIADASPIRSARLSKRYAGVYTTPSRVIRMWDRLNLPTTAHEVAHALADALYATTSVGKVRGIPPAAGRELVALGKALYGKTRPNAGYAGEGWAELVSDYLTTDDIAKRAPNATAWLEGTVLPAFPEVAAAMRQARAEIDVWRGMGARERMRAQTGEAEGKLARLRRELGKYASREGFVEQFAPYEALGKRFKAVAGRALRADEDPFQIATARRGQAGALLAYMADVAMINLNGERTGGRSLREALAPVTKGLRADQVLARNRRAADFWSYLWSRRAIERWGQDKNPGISLADAQYLRQTLETPDFQLAASRYYEWWDGVLDYLGASSPANAELVKRIRNGSRDYVPLARVLDANQSRPGENQGVGGALRRMRGSSLPVKELDVQTLLAAEQVISRAHRDQVMESIFHLAQQPGMGGMIEEVPRAQVKEQVNVEKLRQQLEGMGVDTTNIPADTLLEYYTGADSPKGSDPIVARKVNGETKWYFVRPDLFGALEGIQPARLPLVADLLLGVPARTFRLGTTGLRPAFSLFTNPARDLQTFLMQSTAGANPLRRVAEYFGALGDVVKSGLTRQPSAYRDLFDRLGVMAGQPLGGDVGFARREAKGLFHGKVFKRVTAPIETLRELLSFTEAVPRIAELRLRSKELGWSPGQPLTPEQALALTIAAKRVTTDFSAGGSYAKLWSQAIPFFNANIQGTRGFLRTLQERPAQAVLYGFSMFTVPALYAWWQNKDEDWYRALPWRERYLYWNVPDGNGNVYQIPRPPEWQNAFAVIPEALLDAAHRDNPEAVNAAFGHVFATVNPFDLPVVGKIAWEQARNHMDFFDRPIVPRAQVDLRPGEQSGPYTSWLATTLGRAFPDKVSPRRVDHVIRGVGGGAASDTVAGLEQMLGLRPGSTRQEPSELPVVGKAFRRGGEFSAVNRQISELYDLHFYWQARARNKELAPHLRAFANMLEGRMESVRLAQRIAEQTEDLRARQSVYRDLTKLADTLLTEAKAAKFLPTQQ